MSARAPRIFASASRTSSVDGGPVVKSSTAEDSSNRASSVSSGNAAGRW